MCQNTKANSFFPIWKCPHEIHERDEICTMKHNSHVKPYIFNYISNKPYIFNTMAVQPFALVGIDTPKYKCNFKAMLIYLITETHIQVL